VKCTNKIKGLFGRAPAGSGFTCENTVHDTVAAREREPEEPEKRASPAPVNVGVVFKCLPQEATQRFLLSGKATDMLRIV